MKRIAKFHKVSKERFVADWMDTFEGVSADEAEKIYEESVFQDELLPEAQAMISFPRLILPLSRRDHQDSDRDPCGDGSGVGAEMLSKKRPGI